MRWRTSISPIGVSMDGSFIQAAQLAWHHGQWFLSAAARVGHPSAPGDSPGLPIAELKDVLTRRGFTGRRLVVGLPPEALLTGVLDVPARGSGAPVDAIAQAELARMHQCDPRSLETANWDLPQAGRREAPQVMAVACPHGTAETVLDPFENAGFDVLALDSQLHGLVRASQREMADDGITAILQLGWSAATLVLVADGRIVYHRTMADCGLDRQAKALADVLEMPTESIEAVFKAKTHHGGDLDADEGFYDTIRSVCESGWRQLLAELDAPFTYVRHQYSDAAFKRALLTGQGAAVCGVAPFFAQKLQLPVQPLRPTDILNAIGGLAERAEDPSLITAIGLAQFHR